MILDLVGASYFQDNIDCLTIGGRLLLVGMPGGSEAKINLGQVRICVRCPSGAYMCALSLEAWTKWQTAKLEDRLLFRQAWNANVLGLTLGAALCASSTCARTAQVWYVFTRFLQ